MDHTDRDLLLSFAQLSAALVIQPGGAEFQRRARVWARASAHDSGGGNERWIKAPQTRRFMDEGDSALDTLTIREREVLAHALTGATYEAMADALFVSPVNGQVTHAIDPAEIGRSQPGATDRTFRLVRRG